MQFYSFYLENTAFCHLLASFKEQVEAEGYAKATVKGMCIAVAEFLYRLEHALEVWDITIVAPVHIQQHYLYLETRHKMGTTAGALSGSMLNAHIYALRTFFAFLVKINAIDANPLSGNLDFPHTGPPYRIAIHEDEVQTLFAACRRPLESALLCLAYSGLRRTEITQVNCQDIMWNEGYLIVRESKFHKRREVPLPPKVLAYLKTYYEGERQELFVPGNEDSRKAFLLAKFGWRMTSGRAYKIFKEILYRTELEKDITLHTLRHSFATHLKMRGCPVDTVRALLGHSSVDTTSVYLKYQEQALFKKSHTNEY